MTILEHLKKLAAEQVAQYPQYAGHFDGYTLVRVKRAIRTKLGLAFEAGEMAIAIKSRDILTGKARVTVWSLRNGVDTGVRPSDVEWR